MLSEFVSRQLAAHDASLRLTRHAHQARHALHRRLYEALRRALLEGHLSAGDRLPSSRDLAADLKLSRNTVVAALMQLTVEGYLVSRVGSGTYVSDNVPRHQRRSQAVHSLARHAQPPRLSQRGQRITQEFCAHQLEVQPFTGGIADFSAFPLSLWQRLQNKHWRMSYAEMLDYSYSGGYQPLRRAVADYLRVFRSVQLDAQQVIITSGTQQSLELCAHMLADHDDTVWVEDPAYWGAVKAFIATGLKLHAVPTDAEGIAPGAADDKTKPRLIYVTPSHQYPTGAVMSLTRRQALLATARQHQSWILEDDYDSEFRYSGPPVSSLEGLDADERVLYMGTFSKVMYPGIKLGYLVVPKPLVESFQCGHYDLNRPGQLPVQAALAEFIEQGHFAATIRKLRQTYAERRAALLAALKPCLERGAYISGAEQGLHLCLHLPRGCNDHAIAAKARSDGLVVTALSDYCLARSDLRGLVIGYGYAPLQAIRQCGHRLAQVALSMI
jgi:GntR family transcriptional regulator/MocR family aminotransferase